jgi:beta-ribofuranosylaminobenzene 5'-phosphate synthase
VTRVDITTGSRLHFGLLCAPPESDWHYGGLGLMLNQPVWQINVAVIPDSTEDLLHTSPAVAERAARLLSEFRQLYPQLPAVQVTTRCEVDHHAGLGSGTQLTLSLTAAFVLLSGEPRPTTIESLAAKLGRRQRSAIGTFGFDHGGFIVDEGRTSNRIQRISFPEEWRMVLLTPIASEGLSGSTEEAFFGEREFLDAELVQKFDSLINNSILPSLAQHNLAKFREALATYGEMVGSYYAAAQGGVFSDESIRELTEQLRHQGIRGAVQSSWGPTACIPAASEDDALAIQRAVFDIKSMHRMQVTIAEPRNTGATIRTVASEHNNYRSFG